MAIKDYIRNWLMEDIEQMTKSDADQLQTKPIQEESPAAIGRKAILDDPYFDHASQATIYKQKLTRLSNKLLKDVSLRDWVVSSIIQCRIDTVPRFCQPQKDRFQPGFKIFKRDGTDYTDSDKEEVKILEDFFYRCGKTADVPKGDEMTLGEFMKLTLRDALTFGHISVEKILTGKKSLHRFRPLPAEQVYLVNKQMSKQQITQEISQAKRFTDGVKGDNDPANEHKINEASIEYYKYMQIGYDNRVLAAFGDEDMVFKLFNPQNFADSQGYCYSPLELAIINITNHLNVENYNTQFFTHGYAARGVLHLKGMVTQSQMAAFRRQFYNSISGVQNSWRTPIIGGLDGIEWVPLSGSAREMEYIAFNDSIVRALCAQFQIDPTEIGLDYLTHPTGKSPMQQANNEYKIEASKERGLYPIFTFYEDLINCDMMPAIDPALANKYVFKFVGYSDSTPMSEITHMQAEMTVYSSMNDLLARAQKNKLDEPAAGLPLNAAFWQLVEKNYTRGEIRERFFGDKGAAQRPELAYIPGDQAFLAWSELMLAMKDKKKAEASQQEQMAMMQEQHEREGQAHEQELGHNEEAHQQELRHAQEKHGKELSETESPASIHDAAKTYGGDATKAINVGGKPVKNPLTED